MKNINLENNDYITSYRFARLSDVVYSEVLTENQYSEINPKDHTVISRGKNIVFYKLNSFSLKENDIVFCNLSLINELFKHLNKINSFKNIKIITNQTDSYVTKKTFDKKPTCVSKWYSINIDYENPNLISIPLGLSNDYSPKNPNANVFINLSSGKKIIKKNKMYINYQQNTNLKERKMLIDLFKDEEWVDVDEPNLKLEKYVEKLNSYSFVFCPWGNGIETHRVWETLYAGSIPVLKYHPSYSSILNLPVLFVDNYKDINKKLLDEFKNEMKNKVYKFDKLSMNYWEKLINEEIIQNTTGSVEIYESKLFNLKFLIKNFIKTQINSKYKKIIYYFRQIKKVPSKLTELYTK